MHTYLFLQNPDVAFLWLCAMTRDEVEEYLKKWRVIFERHRLKISRINKDSIRADHTNETETDAKLPTVTRGVARGKCMWKQGRRSGQNQFVTQLCPAGGLGGAASRPAGRSSGSKRIFGNNLLQIGCKSGL